MPRKSKSQDASPYEAIRRMWELPYISLFVNLTRRKFGFVHFTIQEFEDQLLENDNIVVADIFTRLIRYHTDKPVIIENFEIHLQELLKNKNSHYNPLLVNKFVYLTAEEKLQLLSWLTEKIFEERNEDLSDFFNDTYSAAQLRGQRVGQDCFYNTYWYFDDLRLYRESKEKKSGKRDWECVAITVTDWRNILASFRKPSNPHEEELYDTLDKEIFPLVEVQLESQSDTEENYNIELTEEYILHQERADIAAMVKEQDQSTPGSNCSIKQEASRDHEADIHNSLKAPTNGTLLQQQLDTKDGIKQEVTNQDELPQLPADATEHLDLRPISAGPLSSNPLPDDFTGNPQPQQALPADAPFMQQQSQIFVFDTKLANQAAEAVLCGQYKNIIDYHCDQPGTKKILQRYPVKSNQVNRPIYTVANTRPSNTNPSMKGATMMGEPNNPMASVAEWVEQQNANLQQRMNPTNTPDVPMSLPNNNMWQFTGNRPPNPNSPITGIDGPGPSLADFQGPMMPGYNPNANLLQNKVPNEKLTPEQLHRREEQLASLRKIQQMLHLCPENNMMPNNSMGPGMMPENMNPQMSGMFPPDRMPGPGPPGMMGPQGPPNSRMNVPPQMMGSPPGPNGPMPMGQLPPNWDNMTPPQRDWFKLQQEWSLEKRRMHMQAMQGGPAMGMGNPGQGPPPPYIINRRMPGPMEPPTSPNGALPSPHINPGMPGGPNDPAFMFQGHRRPPFDGQPGFNGPGAMNARNFDPMMPGMGERPPGMFFKDNINMPPKNVPTFHRAGNPEPFGAADLPSIGTPTSSGSGPTKPPPSYAQAQKRKRSGDDLDELYKKLQPAPSPQQINYLNQFEGQELTITKQINMAYREPGTSSPAPHTPSDIYNQNQPLKSPMSVPRSATGPGSVPGSTGPASVPGVSTSATPVTSTIPTMTSAPTVSSVPGTPQTIVAPPTPTSAPPTPGSGVTQRLSHFDPQNPMNNQPPTPGGSIPPGSKHSLSNITSSSLANLAKGVENLSNQMQQNMMQGGPFHNIQVQGQPNETNTSQSSSTPPVVSSGSNMPFSSSHSQTPSHSQAPSVNNTFVNATMSIQQLNIQSVGNNGFPGCPGGPGSGGASMQVQQMNHESMGGQPGMPPSAGPNGMPVTSMSMSQMQAQGMMGGPLGPEPMMHGPRMGHPRRFPSPMGSQVPGNLPPGPMPSGPMPSGSMPGSSVPQGPMSAGPQLSGPHGPMSGPQVPMSGAPGPPCPMSGPPGHMPGPGGMSGPPMGHSPMSAGPMPQNQMPGPPPNGGPPLSSLSPSLRQPSTPVSNASVQIQAKAPNTIQYLPANPPSSQPDPSRKMNEIEMLQQRFPSPGPMGPNMDMRIPGPGPKMPPEMMDPRMSMGPGPGQNSMMAMQQGMMMPVSRNGPSPAQMGGMAPFSPPMIGNEMTSMQMQSQQMSMQSGGPMPGPPQGMRPEGPGMMPGQPQPGYNAQFQQFQHQIYSSRSGPGPMMGPGNGGMMGSPTMGGSNPMGGPGMPPGAGMHPSMNDPGMVGPMQTQPGMGPGPRSMMMQPGPGAMQGPGPSGPGMFGPGGMHPGGPMPGPGPQYGNMMQGPL